MASKSNKTVYICFGFSAEMALLLMQWFSIHTHYEHLEKWEIANYVDLFNNFNSAV